MLELRDKTKYLELFYSKLLQKGNINEKLKISLYAIYRSVVRSIRIYGCTVWLEATLKTNYRKPLAEAYICAVVGITGAIRSIYNKTT